MTKECVYRIECKDPEIQQIYIGSSVDLVQRIGKHKYSCNNEKSKDYNYPVYKFIRENGGWDNWQFDIEQDCYGMPKEEIVELEQIFIGCLNPELNSNNASGIDIERNKESIKKSSQKYYENNKESINKSRKIKGKCPQCDKEMRKDSIKRHISRMHPSI